MTKSKQPQYRFDSFEGEWEEKKLGEISNIVRGASPRPIQDPKWFDSKSDIGWLRISELGQEKTRVLKDPHLLLSIAATVGKPVINYVKTGVHDGFLVFLDPKFNREFMFQWLDMFRPYWNKYGQPGSQVNLNSEIVRNQVINLPSLPEQEAIGELFQTVDQLLQLQDQKLATLKEQKQTFLRKMFPAQGQKVPEIRLQGFDGEWEEKKLGEISRMFSGGTPNVGIPEYYNGNIPFIRSAEINSDQTELSITDKGLSNSSAKLVEKNTLLYALYGATSGEVGLSRISGAINQAILAIIPEKKYSSLFIKNWLYKQKSSIIEKYLQGGQGNLSGSIVKELTIHFPSLSEQEAIGNFFQTLDQQIAQSEEKLTELKALKQTLLNRLFV
ncbi:TPA: restriction endonuclease subunit S [Streptococcus pyogenes]|nr:restriction endonuclease subunit S [Streptococcus pyogenes]